METKTCRCCGRELPITEFRTTTLGRMNTCRECVRNNQIKAKTDKKIAKNAEKDVENARSLRLNDFTPMELMAELKRRGYEFTMKYTEVHVVNSKDIKV